jgi:hypothetical protein
VPLNKLIPITENIKMNNKHMSNTLNKADRELNKALTTSLSPSFLLITLKGLNALKALNAFNDFKLDLA